MGEYIAENQEMDIVRLDENQQMNQFYMCKHCGVHLARFEDLQGKKNVYWQELSGYFTHMVNVRMREDDGMICYVMCRRCNKVLGMVIKTKIVCVYVIAMQKLDFWNGSDIRDALTNAPVASNKKYEMSMCSIQVCGYLVDVDRESANLFNRKRPYVRFHSQNNPGDMNIVLPLNLQMNLVRFDQQPTNQYYTCTHCGAHLARFEDLKGKSSLSPTTFHGYFTTMVNVIMNYRNGMMISDVTCQCGYIMLGVAFKLLRTRTRTGEEEMSESVFLIAFDKIHFWNGSTLCNANTNAPVACNDLTRTCNCIRPQGFSYRM